MSDLRQFEHLKIQLEAIKSATNNFSEDNCIGRGGFGKVYKGKLTHSKRHTMVAIKRLDRTFGQGDSEFWKEIIILSLYKHDNIVSLVGFCDDIGEKILVYEYTSKRSLDMYLNNSDLTWILRLKICIGAACGLAIADFGLSKFGPANQRYSFLVSKACGTLGYCDPLYVETGLLTKESDVYSFGVVLFEVLCGRLCIRQKDMGPPLTELVKRCYEGNSLNGIIFGKIKDEINPSSLKAFTEIAYRCLKRNREERPLMKEVVRMLEIAFRYQSNDTIPSQSKGGLWTPQKQGNQSRAPEIDIMELESLFSTASVFTHIHKDNDTPHSENLKPENIDLVHPERASNCEIMLGKMKIPLPDIINAILALDPSALNLDQVDNLIKFCPTEKEMEMIKSYTGDKKMLGQCEQFFLQCANIPRIETKLRVFAFKISFMSRVNNFRDTLNTINEATREIKESTDLAKIMQTIVKMGNTLNGGTESSGRFRLDSFNQLGEKRSTNNKITLLHFLCKVVAEQTPELLDFDKDLIHLQAAYRYKIQTKILSEGMHALFKGVERVQQEFDASVNDGRYQEVLQNFLDSANAQLQTLSSFYSNVGRYIDSLPLYFGEDPSRCPWEQVISTLVRFIEMFKRAHDQNKAWAD
ncbi:unnamed protein product [Lactuca saligna]|uniref:Formin-like protein n=1 Tax=Lactuca saligna TaxID=75948 RepID=A0AA35Y1C0_LACSI|nr:unnamed protein product [Lactuca saligna]